MALGFRAYVSLGLGSGVSGCSAATMETIGTESAELVPEHELDWSKLELSSRKPLDLDAFMASA